MRTGRARRHHGVVRTLEAMLDRYIARGQVDQPPGDEERRYFARPALLQKHRGVGNAGETPYPGADHRSGSATVLLVRRMPVGIVERLACRAQRKDDEVIDLALVLWLHPLVGVEGAARTVAARHLASDLAGQIGDVECLDPAGAALASQDALPSRLDAPPEWRHHAEACDDNASHVLNSSPELAADSKKPVDRWSTARPVSSMPRRASALRVPLKEFCGVADGQNRFRRVIRNFTTKFFFKSHHELDRIEAVGAEVINEARVVDHFFGFNTKVFDHDLLNPLANLTHRSTSCLFHWTRPQDVRAIVVVRFPSQSRIVLIWRRHPTKARRETAGSAPPIYR